MKGGGGGERKMGEGGVCGADTNKGAIMLEIKQLEVTSGGFFNLK